MSLTSNGMRFDAIPNLARCSLIFFSSSPLAHLHMLSLSDSLHQICSKFTELSRISNVVSTDGMGSGVSNHGSMGHLLALEQMLKEPLLHQSMQSLHFSASLWALPVEASLLTAMRRLILFNSQVLHDGIHLSLH